MTPGTRCTAVVPDTLDLADRAALAINGLGGTLDPDLEYLPYGQVHYGFDPPVMPYQRARGQHLHRIGKLRQAILVYETKTLYIRVVGTEPKELS